MESVNLGRLERVDLRKVWLGEASDFTPWLAQEENLALLGDTIGLDLAWEATEKDVGPFRADILCRDTTTNAWVLIENQIERTDHSHLGQLLTYAAGLKAVTIVWIAKQITEEHRAALDWLNEITSEGVNFFGLEIELWKIGDSQIAPKFNVVSQPNDWTDIVRYSTSGSAGTSGTSQLYLEYWATFIAYIEDHSKSFPRRKPQPQAWMDFATGRSNFLLQAVASVQKRYLYVQLAIYDANSKTYFHALSTDRQAIEREIGAELKWVELPERKSSYIAIYNQNQDPSNRSDWENQHSGCLFSLRHSAAVLSPRVKALSAVSANPLGIGPEPDAL